MVFWSRLEIFGCFVLSALRRILFVSLNVEFTRKFAGGDMRRDGLVSYGEDSASMGSTDLLSCFRMNWGAIRLISFRMLLWPGRISRRSFFRPSMASATILWR